LRLACPSEERLGDRDDWHAGCRERSHLLEKVATMLVHADLLARSHEYTWCNPKRVSTPFAPEYGEDALHFTYNYPELLKILN